GAATLGQAGGFHALCLPDALRSLSPTSCGTLTGTDHAAVVRMPCAAQQANQQNCSRHSAEKLKMTGSDTYLHVRTFCRRCVHAGCLMLHGQNLDSRKSPIYAGKSILSS